jgi:hypothetical protein
MTEIKHIAPRFKTSDHKEFATEAEAQRHQAVLDTLEALEHAQRAFEIAVAKEQLTADGQPFSWKNNTYYFVRECYGLGCLPSMGEVRFYYNTRVHIDRGAGFVEVEVPSGDESNRTFRKRINELYSSRKAALAACLAFQEKHLGWLAEEHGKLRQEVEAS